MPVNSNSELITVTLLDQDGNTFAAASDTVVDLGSTSAGGSFLSAVDGTTVITSVTIPGGSSTAGFYYRDSLAGNPTLTGASGLLTHATQTETVTSAPVVLYGSQLLAGGSFQFQFTGADGSGYSVWASTNLVDWSVVETGAFGSLPATFTDTQAASHPARFFRVSTP